MTQETTPMRLAAVRGYIADTLGDPGRSLPYALQVVSDTFARIRREAPADRPYMRAAVTALAFWTQTVLGAEHVDHANWRQTLEQVRDVLDIALKGAA
jgi:hypothetical protein